VITMAIWELVPREIYGNILKFLSGKDLTGFKAVSKSNKSAIKSEKGLIFDAIREQLKEIIMDHQLRSVPNKQKLKLKNQVRNQGHWSKTGYVVKTANKFLCIICDGGVFKVEANIEKARRLGLEHVRPYVSEVEENMQHWHHWASMTSDV
jgi:hypothetical protein